MNETDIQCYVSDNFIDKLIEISKSYKYVYGLNIDSKV